VDWWFRIKAAVFQTPLFIEGKGVLYGQRNGCWLLYGSDIISSWAEKNVLAKWGMRVTSEIKETQKETVGLAAGSSPDAHAES
jgi:hypothetical protein